MKIKGIKSKEVNYLIQGQSNYVPSHIYHKNFFGEKDNVSEEINKKYKHNCKTLIKNLKVK